LSHFIKLLANNNSLIESPILIDNQRILIGFNEKEIRSFLPRQVKREEMDLLLIKTR
ncbi:transcriptional regulator Spx, partial [Lentilactobacillus hilgardii]|nr:transcriptional regulator Spx [Lentilactobacillus hilgardii]